MKRLRWLAIAIAAELSAPLGVSASPNALTAFTVKDAAPAAGQSVTFEAGVTSTDGLSWDPATVGLSVSIATRSGTVLQTSAVVRPPVALVPGETTALFVTSRLGVSAAGTYAARAVVTHDGEIVATSDPVALVVGALHASATVRPKPRAITGTLGSNDTISDTGSENLSLQLNGNLGRGRAFVSTGALSSTPGSGQPLVTLKSPSTVVRAGTTSPTFDRLALGGPSGTGLNLSQNLAHDQNVRFAYLSGAHGSENPFELEALSYAAPVRAGGIALTSTAIRVDGDADTSASSFLRSGNAVAFDFKNLLDPSDAGGAFVYDLNYGIIDYVDALSRRRRVDRALSFTSNFTLLQTAWSANVMRAGAFYPTVAAPEVSPDEFQLSLGAKRTFGDLAAAFTVRGDQSGLAGSPSGQSGHVWTEGLSLTLALPHEDELDLTLSNAINHVKAQTLVESLDQNDELDYAARRGPYSLHASLATDTTQDNSGDTNHSITDSFDLGRSVARGLSLSIHYSLSENLASEASSTSFTHGASAKANYVFGPSACTFGYNQSRELPFEGLQPTPSTGLQAAYAYKVKASPLTLQISATRMHASNVPAPAMTAMPGAPAVPGMPAAATAEPTTVSAKSVRTVVRVNLSEKF